MARPVNFIRYGISGLDGFAIAFRKNHSGQIYGESARYTWPLAEPVDAQDAIQTAIDELDVKFGTTSFPI